jgi:hypothetical protein
MIYRKHPIRSLLTSMLIERLTFDTPRMYMLSPSKSIKGSNYGEFLKHKNVLLCTRLYKYAPNLESLLTQQYVCVMCTLWSDNTCVFTRFHSVKNANTQLIWSSGSMADLLVRVRIRAYARDVIGHRFEKVRNDHRFGNWTPIWEFEQGHRSEVQMSVT